MSGTGVNEQYRGEVRIALVGEGRCRASHSPSNAEVATETPPEYGGRGDSFSATDLVAAGLGACIATSVQAVTAPGGIPDSRVSVTVRKHLSPSPKRICALDVIIRIREALDADQRGRILAAARSCPVHRSLHPEIGIEIDLRCSEWNRAPGDPGREDPALRERTW